MERYELVKEIGAGNFGVAKLMRDKKTGELVAVKFIELGEKIDANVMREIINHRSLRHPNIVRFKEVVLTPTHLAILMEYAAGGELFERICNAGRFSEDEARYFFQQLISGVSYCHAMQVCHRDLKLENTLLDGDSSPQLKICDFGYSKSSLLHSQPKSTVGTPAYIAPEVLSKKEYDGKIADVWSCGVTLYVMLVGAYPFEDPEDPRNFRKTIGRILSVQYSIPDYVYVTAECRHLLSRIFVANPAKEDIRDTLQSRETFPMPLLQRYMLKETDRVALGAMGLDYVCFMPEVRANRGLPTAAVERFHSEDGTFHFPTREMTVTLEDVYQILHLPVVGELVEYDAQWDAGLAECQRVFDDPKLVGQFIPWHDIYDCYDYFPGIVAGLIKGVVCPDRRSHGFPIGWGRIMERMLTEGTRYAWGVCVLAHLYHDMHQVVYHRSTSLSAGVLLL